MSDREAMVRWQGHAREHRTAANSHFLVYAAGVLGLQGSILLNKDVARVLWPRTFIMAGAAAVLSLALGSIVVLLRLRDARLSARVARYRVEKRAKSDIDKLVEQYRKAGDWTNRLLPAQVVIFAVSAGAFLTWLVATTWGKLYPPAGKRTLELTRDLLTVCHCAANSYSSPLQLRQGVRPQHSSCAFMPFTFSPIVIARRDGKAGIDLFEFEGIHKLNNRAANAAYFSFRSSPKGPENRIAVVFDQYFPDLKQIGLPSWGSPEANMVLVAQAAIGDFLDENDTIPVTPSGVPAQQIDCFTIDAEEWKSRSASDEALTAYIRAAAYWSWRYNRDFAFIGAPDVLRTGESLQDLLRVAEVENNSLWAIQQRMPGGFTVKALPSLIKTQQEPTEKPTPARNPLGAVFVDPSRIAELKARKPVGYDLARLVRLCEELNICYAEDCYLAVAALTRALIDHVPPLLGCKSFAEVTSSYAGGRSFKESMTHLENSARSIADSHLHQRIRSTEVLPNRTQVDFSRDLDVLLAEIVRITPAV